MSSWRVGRIKFPLDVVDFLFRRGRIHAQILSGIRSGRMPEATAERCQKETPAEGRGSETLLGSVTLFPPREAFFLTQQQCQLEACSGIANGHPQGWPKVDLRFEAVPVFE